ncbi:hypothetical protein NDU88_008532 [Pleurodeles waltl]|uniref:Uncharacterized protein n=1 Tax=Pleurodeles waltl TaxID=8319 RepID=A0AAV7NZM0_PLEWA|nr:hypothetical protein NDU88_008531 [Pleurodeles waltl]KAJ1120362.1 hypothetical protein NDU88_008532 [Pleurodeles waltl]
MAKRRAPLKTFSIKRRPRKQFYHGPPVAEGEEATDMSQVEDWEAPLTRTFMEQLFGSLLEDFATLKREIAAEVKDLRREVTNLGQRVDTLEQTYDAREKEVDSHRWELITMHDKNQELQYQLEDLENGSRRSNIRVKGVPTQAVLGPLEDFVV